MREKLQENIKQVTPYTPGEQAESFLIKLNTNENPYPPSPKVLEALAALDAQKLRLYPNPDASALRDAIATYHNIKPEQVFVGVGSDDVLALSFHTFFTNGGVLLSPDVSYSFYPVWARLYEIPFKKIPLDENFVLRANDYVDIQDGATRVGGIIIANPNAPTGLAAPLPEIETIIREYPDIVVIVDEAYIDFGGESALSLIDQYDNLLVVRTTSKSRSLAGLRLGYAMGSPDLIKALDEVKHCINSYTVGLPTQMAGIASFADEAYFKANVETLVTVREESKGRLEALGFQVLESASNFFFATHPDIDAKDIFHALKQRGIYVRYWETPRINQYLRITVGSAIEMELFFQHLAEIVECLPKREALS